MRKAGIGIGLAAAAWFATRAVLARRRRLDFRGKAVVITGGSRGLGLVLAREFLARGARVALCARDRGQLDRAIADLRARGPGEILADVCDVTDANATHDWVRNVHERFGAIDVLINNAAVIQIGPLAHMSPEDYRLAMDTNFWGPFNTVQAVRPLLSSGGRIANIASLGGEVAVPHLAPYSASKFALVGFSRGLRHELTPAGIYVTTILPGLMRTGSSANALFKGQHRKEHAAFSIADALPLLTISAESAATQIISAIAAGRAEVVLSLPAKLATTISDLCPELTAEFLSVVARLLPDPAGIGEQSVPGHRIRSALSPSWLTRLGDEAAVRNNEL